MRFALLSLFVSAVVGFTVPANQPAGVYMVTYNPDGTETHSLLSLTKVNSTVPAVTAGSVPSPTRFDASKRQINGGSNTIGCGNYELNHGDTDSAYNALGQQCGGGASVPGGRDFYSIVGCTVAYFCNYNGGADTCFQSEWVAAIQNGVSPVCGSYWAGWDRFSSSIRFNQYGYENVCGAGGNFCGRGTNGR
ncbi:hypothetical protein C8F04DRAFT_1241137 [Mycena alexandri]|uniref:Uncharacterized protein n=1 Tax=Mycena alexandri TaxID=1745969 RepID=A0AAD6WQU0_9AGAR|nr:hypothetical protein C8F04DRAFT_1050931 [Mycena alexandri]KAJ7021789.1 hypothetical protein C8F04DRAFT_1241137 [Mycena alexandri]